MSASANAPVEQTLRRIQVGNHSIHHLVLRDAVTGLLGDPDSFVVTHKTAAGVETVHTYTGADDGTFTRRSKGVYLVKILHEATGREKVELATVSPTVTLVGEINVVDAYGS